MKRFIPVALLLLTLSGCGEKPKESAQKSLDPGFVNFAAILVLDDLISNGIQSAFVSLSPVPIVDPDNTVAADAIVEDFRKDFVAAQDKYPPKLAEGLSVAWNLDHDADAQYGLSFHKEERGKNRVFAGKLSLRFDPEYYSATPYPVYPRNSDVTIICREFTSAAERKNDYLFWVEVAFSKCMAATDYYASIRSQLKNRQTQMRERLGNIYAGKEEISADIAGKLTAYYMAGNAFAEDSICLTGGREECLSNLKNEIIRKYENAEIGGQENVTIRIREKTPDSAKKPTANEPPKPFSPLIKANPAEKPQKNDRTPAAESRKDVPIKPSETKPGDATTPATAVPETKPDPAAPPAPPTPPKESPSTS